MSMPTCESCKAYSVPTAECRRNAPVAFPAPNGIGQVVMLGVYPNTDASKWCCAHIPVEVPNG
jgi:hypothetical protein